MPDSLCRANGEREGDPDGQGGTHEGGNTRHDPSAAPGGKLVVVQKNAVLLERPVLLWERMFATFGALGPAICPPGWGESLLRSHFTEGIRAVLSGVSEHDGPAGLDLVCQWGWDAVSRGGRVAGAPATHRDTWRRCNDRDVRAAVGVLASFGALRLDGPPDARRVALTPLGRAALPSCW